jgi:hypothetical protein
LLDVHVLPQPRGEIQVGAITDEKTSEELVSKLHIDAIDRLYFWHAIAIQGEQSRTLHGSSPSVKRGAGLVLVH